jgi:hypothetical protein
MLTPSVSFEGRWLSLALALGGALVVATACGGSTGGSNPTCDAGAFCGTGGATGGSGGTATGGVAGLGGGTGGSTGGVTGGGTGGGTPGTAHPPAPDPNAPAASGTTPTTLAVYRMFMGDTDLLGNPDPSAWKTLGYDIDGLWSTKNDVAHCMPQQGATKSAVQTDGEGGIDNSFGSNLMPIFSSLFSDFSPQITQAIQAGDFTLLFRLGNLAPQPSSQNAISAQYFDGAATGQPPSWNGTDAWPVTYESVNGGSVSSPKLSFPSSYLVNGTWVSSDTPVPGPVTLRLDAGGITLVLPITHFRASVSVTGTGTGATGSGGVISGILATELLIAELKKVAGQLDPNLCQGATFDSIAQQVRAASDIMADGSNGNPSKTCDGISIGLGFDARAVQLGAVAPPVQPTPDPCAGF